MSGCRYLQSAIFGLLEEALSHGPPNYLTECIAINM